VHTRGHTCSRGSLDCSDAQGNVDLRALVDESLVTKAVAGEGAGAAGDSESGGRESKSQVQQR
jgi:hypothetical protein